MKKVLKTLMFTIGFAIILSIGTKIEAASASISASTTATVGKSVTVTVKINAATWNLKVSGATSGTIVGMNMDGKNQSTTKTYKITPSKAGKYTIYLKGDITDANGTTSDINKSVTITAKDSTTTNNNDDKNDVNKDDNTTTKKSTNANLSTLGVTPKEYDFSGFTANTTSYSVTVPSSVDKLNVAYKTADSKATAKVTGNTNLEVGTNNIKVVVTAEDGKTTKTYTIKVTKLATEDEKPGNIIDDDKDLDICLTSLSLKNLEITPAFASDVYSYEATINMDEKDFSDVVVNAVANDEKATIEITGNTNLVEGENLINVIVKSSNGNEKVYQITVNKVSQKSEVVSSGKIKKEHLIIGAYVFVLVIIFAVIIIKHIRNKKYEYEEDDETFDDTQEIDLVDATEETHDNFIEELYKKRNNGEELQKNEKEIMEDIEEENDRIFNKPKEGSTVEYDQNEIIEEKKEELLEDLRKKRKGKHF